MLESKADISVVICTRNRAESLRQTLDCLARAEKGALRCEVVVVDNAGSEETCRVSRSYAASFPVHYLREPTAGKGHALNRALADAPLGDIVAVLDDDMSPQVGWLLGVRAICDRWPDHDWFTGRSHIIWPDDTVPAWCLRPGFRGWAFSVLDGGPSDKEAPDGRWFSGNHFWFRSRVLAHGRRFDVGQADLRTHIEMAEPQFMLQLAEEGRGGVSAPDAVCGHRIQRDLLTVEAMAQRAGRAGRGFARARLQPYRRKVKQARLFHQHPGLLRLYCVASLAGWSALRLVAALVPCRAVRIEMGCQVIERIAAYREYLHVASQMKEYRLFAGR